MQYLCAFSIKYVITGSELQVVVVIFCKLSFWMQNTSGESSSHAQTQTCSLIFISIYLFMEMQSTGKSTHSRIKVVFFIMNTHQGSSISSAEFTEHHARLWQSETDCRSINLWFTVLISTQQGFSSLKNNSYLPFTSLLIDYSVEFHYQSNAEMLILCCIIVIQSWVNNWLHCWIFLFVNTPC